jgi:hypothetical protein
MKTSLTLAALVVAAFLVTLVVLNHGAAPPPSPSLRSHAPSAPARVVAAAERLFFPSPTGTAQPPAPIAEQRPSSAVPTSENSSFDPDAPYVPPDPSTEEVPAALSVRNSGGTTQREVLVQNMSTMPMTLRVTADADGNQSVVQVDIPPRRRSNLTKAGLAVDGPTTVTLSSPPYRDRMFELK